MSHITYVDAQKIWDYMVLGQPAVSADILLVLGSIDERVSTYAAKLSKNIIITVPFFSGGIAHGGGLLKTA